MPSTKNPLMSCPRKSGTTTVRKRRETMEEAGMDVSTPTCNTNVSKTSYKIACLDYTSFSSSAGVTNTPSTLPSAELNTAAASFPPTARVRMTAEETGGGMHDKVVNPERTPLPFSPPSPSSLRAKGEARWTKAGTRRKVKHCTKTWRRH